MRCIKGVLIGALLLSGASHAWADGALTPAAMSIPGGDRSAASNIKVMVTGDVVFTIVGGPIRIVDILSVCVTANDVTASTLQWQSVPTVGSATTITGATTTLASIAAGATIRLAPTALSTAPVISLAAAGGTQLGTNLANQIVVQEGTLKLVIATGSTTGTWRHYIRYTPLSPSSTVY